MNFLSPGLWALLFLNVNFKGQCLCWGDYFVYPSQFSLGPGSGVGKRRKISASEASREAVWGRENVAPPVPPSQATARLASFAHIFPICSRFLPLFPTAEPGPGLINNYSSSPNGLWVNSYWLRGHEGKRNNCFSKIQLVGQKYRDKTA